MRLKNTPTITKGIVTNHMTTIMKVTITTTKDIIMKVTTMITKVTTMRLMNIHTMATIMKGIVTRNITMPKKPTTMMPTLMKVTVTMHMLTKVIATTTDMLTV